MRYFMLNPKARLLLVEDHSQNQANGAIMMIKNFYLSPWHVLAIAFIAMVITGTIDDKALVIFGLIALALLGRSPSKTTKTRWIRSEPGNPIYNRRKQLCY